MQIRTTFDEGKEIETAATRINNSELYSASHSLNTIESFNTNLLLNRIMQKDLNYEGIKTCF